MQKKLIALAVAGAFVAPAAFADSGNVTIYGVMSASYDIVDSGYSNSNGQRTNQINDNSSRLGFKGSEDLGNGLSAVWQIESNIHADGASRGTGFQGQSNGALNNRNTFVGLSGKSWGTAILGRHDTPYKLATRSLDVFADGIADNRSIMGHGAGGATTFDGRQSNVIAYISPTFNGFNAAAAYVAGAENALTTGQQKGNAWSAMAMYNNGPWMGSLAYERHNVGATGTGTLGNPGLTTAAAAVAIPGVTSVLALGDVTLGSAAAVGTAVSLVDRSEKAWKLGVGYKANAFRVGFAYEKTSDDFNGGSDMTGHHSWYLAGGYTFGNNEVKAAYTKAGDMAIGSNTGAKQWALGLDHNFSKRTKVFALYTKLSNDAGASYTLTGGSNGGTANANNVVGLNSSPSAWSFGMTHNF